MGQDGQGSPSERGEAKNGDGEMEQSGQEDHQQD
jgi:hypothetical protein